MKKITLIILLISAFSMGQYFDQEQAEEPESNHTQFFDEQQSPHTQEPEPEYGTDANPIPVPIDDWTIFLPLAGMAVGVYFIRRRKIVND